MIPLRRARVGEQFFCVLEAPERDMTVGNYHVAVGEGETPTEAINKARGRWLTQYGKSVKPSKMAVYASKSTSPDLIQLDPLRRTRRR